jgi:hypothetical protein
MRLITLLVSLLPCLAGFSADEPSPAYTLHEWGVFRNPRGSQFAQQDFKREWKTFPSFFHSDPKVLGRLGGVVDASMSADKPVIWIRSDKPLSASITVAFPGGRPLVWWPQATVGAFEAIPTLRFDILAKQKADVLRPVAADHWLARLRQVPGSYLTSRNVESDKSPMSATEGDTLLYYDGIIPALPEPTVGMGKDGNYEISFPDGTLVLDALLVERDGTNMTVSKWIDHGDATAGRKNILVITKLEPCDRHLLETRKKEFVERLTAAGLTIDEAAALLAVWEEQLFGSYGLTVFYRIPQQRYDEMLPLLAVPKPAATVRVGLIVHTHLEPDLNERVAEQIALLESSDPVKRNTALMTLTNYGGAAFAELRKAAKTAKPEVANLCREVLAAADLSSAIIKAGE